MRRLNLAATVNHNELGRGRWLLGAMAVLACTAVACQDGPNQTYSPPPANAGWNDGRTALPDGGLTVPSGTATNSTAPFADDAGNPIGSGGTNANEICTPAQIAAINPLIGLADIIPPNQMGLLNLAGSDGD